MVLQVLRRLWAVLLGQRGSSQVETREVSTSLDIGRPRQHNNDALGHPVYHVAGWPPSVACWCILPRVLVVDSSIREFIIPSSCRCDVLTHSTHAWRAR